MFTFWLLINQTSNNIFCTVNNMSYPCDKIPAGFSYHTALRFNRTPQKKNPSHRVWNHVGSIVSCQIVPSSVARDCLRLWLLCVCLPSACAWKTTTEAVVDGWKGLFSSSSSLAAEKEGESVGRSFSVTLAGRAGSSASMGAMMQWDSRHSGFPLKKNKK